MCGFFENARKIVFIITHVAAYVYKKSGKIAFCVTQTDKNLLTNRA